MHPRRRAALGDDLFNGLRVFLRFSLLIFFLKCPGMRPLITDPPLMGLLHILILVLFCHSLFVLSSSFVPLYHGRLPISIVFGFPGPRPQDPAPGRKNRLASGSFLPDTQPVSPYVCFIILLPPAHTPWSRSPGQRQPRWCGRRCGSPPAPGSASVPDHPLPHIPDRCRPGRWRWDPRKPG